jgi:DNA-binding NarL/FixJ family response regulator
LSPSERRVAELTAEGSNKAIAAEPFARVQTVELHLAHATRSSASGHAPSCAPAALTLG